MKMHLQKARRAGGSFLRVTSTFGVIGRGRGCLLVKAETGTSRNPKDRPPTNNQTLTSPTAKPSPQPAHRELLSIHTIDRASDAEVPAVHCD